MTSTESSEHPIGSDPRHIQTPNEFAATLAALTRRQVRGLADKSGVARSTISSWTTGQHLPNPNQIDQLKRLLVAVGVSDADQDAWADALLRVRNAPGPRGADRLRQAPYLGLAPFGEDDAERFFGREDTVSALLDEIDAVRAAALDHRMVFLVGASGEGKSSVLRAGVAVELARRPETSVVVVAPASDEPTVLDGLGAEVVVIVDQFEQLFIGNRTDLLDAIVGASGRPEGPTVVAGVRSDFYPRLVEIPEFTEGLRSHQIVLAPMGDEGMRRAIVEPARRANVDIEPGLVEMMLNDVAPSVSLDDRPNVGVLPLLSHALLETWARGSTNVLKVSDYRALGGLNGALEKTAEVAYGKLDPAAAEAARDLFRRLVNVDAEGLITRRHAGLDEIAEADGGDGVLTSVMWHFVDARLLRVEGSTLTLSHEVLLRAWSRLRAWVADDRDAIRLHRELVGAAESWTEAYEDDSGLLVGGRLERARSWLASPVGSRLAGSSERRLIDASERRAERQATVARRRFRRVAALAAVTSVLAVVAGVATVVARDNRRAAQEERVRAEVRDLANRSRSATDPYVATFYAVEAVQWTDEPLPVARTAFMEATRRISAQQPRRSGADLELPTADVAFSPDGATLAVLTRDGAIHLLDAADRTELAVSEAVGSGQAITWSPDGSRLATSAFDGVIRSYDAETLEQAVASTDVAVTSARDLAWSPDGGAIAVTTNDGLLVLLDADSLAPLGEPIATGPSVATNAAWHPDGDLVVVSNFQGVMTVVDRTTRTAVGSASIGGGVVANGLSWNPDGNVIAVTSSDTMVRYFDSATLAQLGPPVATGASYALNVVWSTDGTRVATVNQDGSLRMFSSVDHRPIGDPVPTGSGGANAIAWNPAGTQIVTANEGGNLRFFELSTDAGSSSFDGARAALTADASRFVTTNFDDTIRLYDAATLAPVGSPVAAGGVDLIALAWSPAGDRFAVGAVDGTVSIRAADDPATVLTSVGGPDEPVMWLGWAADDALYGVRTTGKVLRLTTDDLATVAVFDKPTTATTATTASVALDGSRLAIGGSDGMVTLLSGGALEQQGDRIMSGAAEATGVALDSTGRRVVTANADGTLQVVSVPGGEISATYTLADAPTSVAWSPADDLVTVGTSTGSMLLFTTDLELLGTANVGDSAVRGLIWAPDGTTVFATHASGTTTRIGAWDPSAACELVRAVLPADDLDRLMDIPDATSHCASGKISSITPLPATSGRLP